MVWVVIGHGHRPLGYCQYDPVPVLGAHTDKARKFTLIKLPIHNILCPYLSLTLLHSHPNLSSELHGNQPLLSPQHHALDTAIFVLVCVLVCTHILE